ncbi:MAG: MFS transporter [Chitinophagales bacterium]|nr:MFS transporter [Chitinophagales bacterium]
MANHSDAFASLRISNFRSFLSTKVLTSLAILMQQTVIGWQVYELTGDKLSLGLIGLSEAVPFIVTTFYSGYASDKFNRKYLLLIFTFLLACGMGLLSWVSYDAAPLLKQYGALPLYVILALNGISRAFLAPLNLAIQARIVPKFLYANAATWSSNTFYLGAIVGPIAAGLLLEVFAPWVVYSIISGVLILSFLVSFLVPSQSVDKAHLEGESFISAVSKGIKFVFKTEAIVSAISLDLFAVLFGGVAALLPAFCKDILFVGPAELGVLKTALFAGSVVMGIAMAYYPPTINAGRNLLASVALFGVSIIGFALSGNFYLSYFFLFMAGVFDNVSVIIRATIMQVFTPDDMRGRVGAVNSIFIKSSNEIGDFESGAVARLIGLVPAVIFGGIMTLIVVGVTNKLAPSLKKLKL